METVSDCPIELPLPEPLGRGGVISSMAKICFYWDHQATQNYFITYIYAYFMYDNTAAHEHDFQTAVLFYDKASVLDVDDSPVDPVPPDLVFCGRHFKIYCDFNAKYNSSVIDRGAGPYVSFEAGAHSAYYVQDRTTYGRLRSTDGQYFRNLSKELDSLSDSAMDSFSNTLADHRVTLPRFLNDERIRVRCQNDKTFTQKYEIANNGAGLIWNDPEKFLVIAEKVGIIK